jgi:hypothetical protein
MIHNQLISFHAELLLTLETGTAASFSLLTEETQPAVERCGLNEE